MQLQAAEFLIYGLFDSIMYYDEKLTKWKLMKVTDPDTYAIMNTTGSPMGTHLYEKSEGAGGGSFIANIYTCNDDEEFVCKVGTCIPIGQR